MKSRKNKKDALRADRIERIKKLGEAAELEAASPAIKAVVMARAYLVHAMATPVDGGMTMDELFDMSERLFDEIRIRVEKSTRTYGWSYTIPSTSTTGHDKEQK